MVQPGAMKYVELIRYYVSAQQDGAGYGIANLSSQGCVSEWVIGLVSATHVGNVHV